MSTRVTFSALAVAAICLGLGLAGCATEISADSAALGFIDPAPLDTAAIEAATGMKGTLAKDNTGADVYKLTQGRTDVPIAIEGRRMEPFMGFSSWAAFQAGTSKP